MSGPEIFLEREGDLAHLVLNRPEKRNAVTEAMWLAIPRLLDEVEHDPAIKVLIVRGADARAFAAGADIGEFERVYATRDSTKTYAKAIHTAMRRLGHCAKPTIALVQGPCVGGGCGIALSCDLRFADESGRFGITPAKLGLVYTLEDTKKLVDLVGPAKAKDILYTGRILDAPEALSIGLIDRIVPSAELHAAVRAYALGICETSQFSHRATKRIVQMILDGVAEDFAETDRLFLDSFAGEDFHEGRDAFMAKRKPLFPFRG
jgi:enoyl-CoA hydratase/carnithine racemase